MKPRRLPAHVRRADPGDEIDPRNAKGGEPCRLIGRRAARLEADRRPPVRSACQRPLRTDNDVRHQTSPMTRMRGAAVMATWPARRARCDSPGFASSQQFHEIALAAVAGFERRDIIFGLRGRTAQAAHAGDHVGGFRIGPIAAGFVNWSTRLA